MKQLEKEMLTVWRMRAGIDAVLYAIALIGFYVLNQQFFHLDSKWFFIGIALFGVFSVFQLFVFPSIKYRRFSYEVREDEVELVYGLFIETRMIIPMNRVQNVKTEQGPLLKKFSLSSLHIATAANTEKIPGIITEEALTLRNTIANLAKVDEHDE